MRMPFSKIQVRNPIATSAFALMRGKISGNNTAEIQELTAEESLVVSGGPQVHNESDD